MSEGVQGRQEDRAIASSTPTNRQEEDPTGNQRHRTMERNSNRGSSRNRSSSTDERRNRGSNNQPGGDPDGSDGDGDSDGYPHRNNPHGRGQSSNNPPTLPRNGGGGRGNPGGGGGGNGPSAGGSYPNTQPQGNIPYGNLVATIRNKLKQDQLPVWDGNKDTAIEYFWKIQQLAALEV